MSEQRTPGGGKIGRRRLMKGAGVAVAALAAETLAARPAFAGVDGDVVLGASNSETNPTAIINTAAATDAFRAFAATVGTAIFGSSPTGFGVHGKSGGGANPGTRGQNTGNGPGVSGDSVNGNGVVGTSTNGSGVSGLSLSNGNGVSGQSQGGAGVGGGSVNGSGVSGLSTNGSGVSGFSPNSIGVSGQSQGGAGVGGSSTNGVGTFGASVHGTGVSGQSAEGAGVSADSLNGLGVNAFSTNSDGVRGVSGQGEGVVGVGTDSGVHGTCGTSSGAGVIAESTSGGDGLRVIGRSTFERSGTVVIPSGSKSAVVPISPLSASSLVLALMQNVAGGVLVKAAVPDPANAKFTVFLNKAPASPATATVAWFIVN